MTKRPLRRRDRGFTLIEVLIATAIFAIGSLGILAMVTTSINLQRGSRQSIEATSLANWKMDRLQIVGATDPEFTSVSCTTGIGCFQGPAGTTPTGTVTTIRLSDVINQPVSSSIYYELVTFVDTPQAAYCGSCYRARVTVFWPRDPNKQVIPAGSAGFLDCSAAANANLCHRADFYSYRQH